MLIDTAAWVLPAILVALLADALLGEPAWLYRRVPHPVVLIGAAIGRLEARLLDLADPPPQTLMGVLLLGLVAGGAAAIGLAVHAALRPLAAGWLVEGLAMSTLLAQRSLAQHVAAVADGLRPRPRPGTAARWP